jgi:fibronectin type 3 domain-containing protein
MTVFARDTFTATDGTLLGARTAEAGGQWTNFSWGSGSTTPPINGGRAETAANTREVYLPTPAPGADYTVEFDIHYTADDDTSLNPDAVQVWLRSDTTVKTGYYLELGWYLTSRIGKAIAGTTSTSNTYYASPRFAAGQTVRVRITVATVGSEVQIRVYYDGVLRQSFNDTAADRVTAAGYVGVHLRRFGSTNKRIDNLIAYTGVLPSISDAGDETFYNNEPGVAVAGAGFKAAQGTQGLVVISPSATDPLAAGYQAQTVQGWTDTQVTIRTVRGSMSTGTNLYLYVRNDDGNWSAPWTVQFQADPLSPTIFGVVGAQPGKIRFGQTFTVDGIAFGPSQGTGGVTYEGVAQTPIVGWADTLITATAQWSGLLGQQNTLTVTVNGGGTASLEVEPEVPAGGAWVTLTDPLADAAARIPLSGGSMAVGGQVAVYGITGGGTVTPMPDGSAILDATVTSFKARYCTPAGVWGAEGTITIGAIAGDTTAPTVPTGVAAVADSETAVTVSWSASADAGSGVKGYYVFRGGVKVSPLVTGTSWQDTGRAAWTQYAYSVSAVDNADNESAASASVTVRTRDDTAPSVPGNVVATPGGTTVTITWNSSTDAASGLAGYRVFRNGVAMSGALVTGTSYTDTSPQPSVSYTYTVRAVDVAGNESAAGTSNTITTGGDTTAPSVPATLSVAQSGAGTFTLQWPASTDTGSGIRGYHVYRNGTKLTTLPIAALTYADSTPSTGVEYTYEVSAVDLADNESAKRAALPVMLTGSATGPGTGPVPGPIDRVSKVSICNIALVKLGASTIDSLTEDSKAARALSTIFDRIRDAELARHFWNFAKARRKLAEAISDEPNGPFSHRYALPTDWLTTIYVGNLPSSVNLADFRGYDPGDWSHEGPFILTNTAPPADLYYIRRITDPTRYHALFVEALACRLAMEVADALTNSTARWQKVATEYRAAIAEARRVNAIQNPAQQPQDGDWMGSRF